MAELFRDKSLEKLNSPEQLDRLIVITSPFSWIAMIGGGIIVLAALLWAFFGNIPITEEAPGIFVGDSGRVDGDGKTGSGASVICYMPLDNGKKIKKGMEVHLYPTTFSKEEYGHIRAVVVKVDDYVTSYADVVVQLGDESLADKFAGNDAIVAISCEPMRDPSTVSGYEWSSAKGAKAELAEGTLVRGSIVTDKKTPITMLIPKVKDTLDVE